ncbi:MAG: hypothetical protein CMQ46_03395 [Gammaproteobacteria bacterium]|nr:hypothetical protein [Gammaproteobacteria bacterium]MBJ54293.1 hypothetical protein [Gammaproteobacteria bacterium]HBN16286.1 hypothetical protein [Pseudohongiella sp.]|tara:strand:- start:80 stop:862 length:783 start_codon:yes stop_codon:yes gene_type:complete
MEISAAPASNHDQNENLFFLIYSILPLAIVLIGFAPSLFLRVAFEAPPIPFYLHLHGAILTGWFVILVAQAWFIYSQNHRLHRKLGPIAAGYGVLVVMGGLMATSNVVARGLAQGITLETDMSAIDPALGSGISFLTFISGVIWANIVSVVTFAVLLSSAIIFRRRSDIHKRLILIATVAILGPALARISRLEFFGGEQGPFIPLALLALLAIIVVYDLIALKRVHRASLAGISVAIALSVLGTMIAGSEFGLGFVRSLA